MILILIATVVLVVWALKDPFVGLLGVLMLNVLRPGEIYPVFANFHIERIAAIVVLGSTLIHEHRFAVPKITKTVLFFWATMFLSIPMAYWIGNAISATIAFGQIIAYHILIVTLTNTEKRFRAFLITFSVLNGWLAASSLYLYLSGEYIVRMGIERAVGLTSAGGDPNTLSNTLVSGLPLVLLLLTKDSSKMTKLVALGVAVVSVLTVISTGSRMGFFSLLFMIGVFVATRKKGLILVPVAIALLAIGWTFIPQQYKERYETVNNLEKDDSYQNRILAWKAGWEMFKANPITGMGTDNFTYAAGGKYWPGTGRKIWLNAHSLPMKAIGDLGALGTGAFIYMLVTLFKLNSSLKKRIRETSVSSLLRYFPLACNFSLIVLLFAGYSSHNLYRNTWFMLASLSGALQLILDSNDANALETEKPLVLEPNGGQDYSGNAYS